MRALAALALAACGHVVAPAPPDPLWTRASVVVGDGRGHLPRPARALVAIEGAHALAATEGGGLAEIDLARGEVTRSARGAIDGEVEAMTRLRDGRVLAVGAGADHERAWWIDARRLTAVGVDVTGADGGDRVRDATGVAASADGKAIAITGARLPLALRDPRDLSIARALSPERGWSNPAFVGDAYLVAFHRGLVVPYELATGKVAVDRPPSSSVGFFSPDGLAILHPSDLVHLELTDLHDPDFTIALSSADPIDVAWAPDGRHVAVVDADRVVAYDLPSGDAHPIAVPGTRSRAVFARGDGLAITADGAIWRVDAATGRAFPPPGPNVGAVAFVAPAGGGLIAIADRWRAIAHDGAVRASGAWRGLGGPAFAVSPGGARVVASSAATGEIFVEAWDAASGRSLVSAVADDGVTAVDARDDGTIVVATPGGVWRLDADGAADAEVAQVATTRWAPPVDVAGDRVVYARAGAIAVTDLAATRAIATAAAFDCDASATVRLSRDGARLAVVSGARVAVYDVARGALISTARWPGPITALAIDASGVIAATEDRVIVWAPERGTAIAIATPSTVTAIERREEQVALGFADGRAGVWTTAALGALGRAVTLEAAGAPPARCPGDPLAVVDEDPGRARVTRLPPRE